ncbi:hypothetical protein BDM02DRAFT_3183873 [Thelephora ganbajun]|uniref:Uncharacterized protein n=1 Tax=Thelephora ganbajun TaxID=370292 RepID=A0ACB6ZRJ3_THEGA|nr:hypothetical protein BDM02DRAFT_3183873 [Thelephora ganbajun]
MSDSSQKPWSNNPNAPKIPYELYFGEKTTFAGILIGAISYGIVIVLFLQCMGALFDPVNRRSGGVRWGLVAYSVAMFSFVTIFTAMNLNVQSISFIDNREFPGVKDVLPPGPLGYQLEIYSNVLSIVPNLMFLFNNWLADGLLLYRCYVIYAKNIWVIAFPCLMYLASLAMGIMLIYQTSQPDSSIWNSIAINFGLPYFSISVSLNILLTLMIVTRLVLHSRKILNTMGAPAGAGGLYKAIVTMLIESSALYAVSSILFIGPWGANSHVADIFLPILAETQVIAPLLIIQRVANQSALTSNIVVSGPATSLNFRSRGKSTGASSTLPDGYSMDSVGRYGKGTDELGVGVESTIDFRRGEV